MNPLVNRLQDLEARYERLLLLIQQMDKQVANLTSQIQQLQSMIC